ncbi:MAG: hypothetical protein ACTHK4_01215 [Mycobacteriales bacterium]
MRRRLVVTTVAAAAALAAGPALAVWNATASSTPTSAAAVGLSAVQPPATATATVVSSTSIKIRVTAAPSSGVVPTAYRVQRGATTVTGCDAISINTDCTDAGLTAGTQYTYNVYGRVGANWVGTTPFQLTSTTSAAPALQAITAGSAVNTGSPASWTVSFTQPVSGVTASNFSITPSGASATVASVTAGGGSPSTTWTVTSSNTSGSGSVRLDLANKDNIADSGGTGLTTTTPVTGTSVTVNAAGSVAVTELDRSGNSANYSFKGTSSGGGTIALTVYSSYNTSTCSAGTTVTTVNVSGSAWITGTIGLTRGSTYYVKAVMSSPSAASPVYSIVAGSASNNQITTPTATGCS